MLKYYCLDQILYYYNCLIKFYILPYSLVGYNIYARWILNEDCKNIITWRESLLLIFSLILWETRSQGECTIVSEVEIHAWLFYACVLYKQTAASNVLVDCRSPSNSFHFFFFIVRIENAGQNERKNLCTFFAKHQ